MEQQSYAPELRRVRHRLRKAQDSGGIKPDAAFRGVTVTMQSYWASITVERRNLLVSELREAGRLGGYETTLEALIAYALETGANGATCLAPTRAVPKL